MQIIIPTASTFEQMVGLQKRADGQQYRLMTYVLQQPVADGLLLYNTLTCSLVLLTPDEAVDLTASLLFTTRNLFWQMCFYFCKANLIK